MKKIIVLLLTLSLLLCMNAIAFAAEGDDGGNEPITTVGDAPETSVESSIESEADPTEDTNEAETSAPAEQSDESETSDPAAESGTSETTESTDESTAPEGDASIGDSEASQEPTGNEAEGDMQPANNAEPVSNGEMLSDPSPASNATYNVTVEWTGLSFTYHEPEKGTWNPTTKTYDGGGAGYWTASDGNAYGTIKVTSKQEMDFSNMFDVKFSFKKNADFTPFLAMRFSDDPDSVKTSMKATGNLRFTTETGQNPQSIYLYPYYDEKDMNAEVFANANNTLGTITITIEAFSGSGDPGYSELPEIFD